MYWTVWSACGLLFWKTTWTLLPALLRTLWRRRQVPSGIEFKIQTSGNRKCLFMLPDRIKMTSTLIPFIKDEEIFLKFFHKMKEHFLFLPFFKYNMTISFFLNFLNLFQPLFDVCDLSDRMTEPCDIHSKTSLDTTLLRGGKKSFHLKTYWSLWTTCCWTLRRYHCWKIRDGWCLPKRYYWELQKHCSCIHF